MKVWAHKLGKVTLMLKNSCKEQVVGLIYPITKINNEPTPVSVEKKIWVNDLKDKSAQDVVDHWNEFYEFIEIEKGKYVQDSQRGFKCTLTNFKGSNGL
jgi:hypothetical protein